MEYVRRIHRFYLNFFSAFKETVATLSKTEYRMYGVTLVLLALLIVIAIVYSLLATLGHFEMTQETFLVILLLLLIFHLVAFKATRIRVRTLPLRARIFRLFWGGIIFWYWGFAPFYYLLVVQTDPSQITVVAFTFLWEVPAIGRLFITVALYLFRPIQRFIDGEKPEDMYALILRVKRYPIMVAVLLYIFTIIGFTLGTLQIRYFGELTLFESIKSVLVGFVISLFLGTFFYLALHEMLRPVRLKLKSSREYMHSSFISMRKRVVMLAVVLVTSSLLLINLIVVRSLQGISNEEAIREARRVASYTESHLNATVSTLESVDMSYLSENTLAYITSRAEGFIEDHHIISKIVAFRTTGEGRKELAIVELPQYYRDITQPLMVFLLVEILILFFVFGVVFYFVNVYVNALRYLSSIIEDIDESDPLNQRLITTSDELEALSDRLHEFLRQIKKRIEF